jgi:hypothetical protein
MLQHLLILLVIGVLTNAQIPCDDAYGQYCPENSGFEVGECLKKVEQSELSAECKDYINLHDVCRNDINTHCIGKEYTGDAVACLAEWTKPEVLSAVCLEALPKKEEKKKVMSDTEKKKAAHRRK